MQHHSPASSAQSRMTMTHKNRLLHPYKEILQSHCRKAAMAKEWTPSSTDPCTLFLVQIIVARQNQPLEFSRVRVPKLGCLPIQRTRTKTNTSQLKSLSKRHLSGCEEQVLIWLSQQTLQAQQHALHVIDRTPLILQDIETDSPAEVDIGVVYRRLEQHRWWSIWVVRWELK